jgi:putative ABC transport system ATP-binding protein
MSVLIAQDLYRFYHAGQEETLALRGVSCEVRKREMVAVMGPSGSGKSTLLSCLAGLDEPDGGHVEIDGQRLSRRSEVERAAIRASSIGMMMQTGNLFDHLTVEQNVLLSMQLADKMDASRIDTLLEKMGLLAQRRAWPAHLSGGEAARVALAVALAAFPALLLADEPTGEVDEETEQQVLNLISQYCQTGGAAILVTHSDAVAHFATRVIQLQDGYLVKND